MSQKSRLLEAFHMNGGILSTYDLCAIRPPIMQYQARLKDLRDKDGYDMESWQDPNEPKKWYYRLKPKKDLFAA